MSAGVLVVGSANVRFLSLNQIILITGYQIVLLVIPNALIPCNASLNTLSLPVVRYERRC